jgi:hypothetical protein
VNEEENKLFQGDDNSQGDKGQADKITPLTSPPFNCWHGSRSTVGMAAVQSSWTQI